MAFAIIISGAPGGQWEQEKYRVRATLRQDKATKDTCDRVETLQTVMEKYLRTGEGGTELRQLAETPHYQEVLHYVVKGGVLPPDDHPIITFWRLNMDYQPLTIIPDIRCPVLSIWGEKDFLVDSHQAATMAASAFKKSGHLDYTNATKNSVLFARNFKKVFAGTLSKFLSIMGISSFYNRQRLF